MNNIPLASELFSEHGIKCEIQYPISEHTTFRIGGSVPLVVFPADNMQAAFAVKTLNKLSIPYQTVGNCSNILFPDSETSFAVIKTDLLKALTVDELSVRAQSGLLLSRIANEAQKHGLSGMEQLFGIPGTLGGAVFMNAGAYGAEISQLVSETEYVSSDGEIKKVVGTAHSFGYRKSIFTSRDVIISSVLNFRKGIPEEIKAKMSEISAKRSASQPLEYPSAGSVFKRPEGYYAGKLIEDSGLKGFSIGGAQVSQKHAGFIINKGNASSDDVKRLIDYIKKTVYEKFGVELETEIRIV